LPSLDNRANGLVAAQIWRRSGGTLRRAADPLTQARSLAGRRGGGHARNVATGARGRGKDAGL